MKNLITRALTGIVFVALLAGSICWHPLSFLSLFALITGLSLWEFQGLIRQYEETHLKQILGCVGGVYLFVATFCYTTGLAGGHIFLPYLLFLLYLFIGELYSKAPNPIHDWAYALWGQVYCAGSFSLLNFIANQNDMEGTSYHPLPILALFVFIWLNDTGAYLVGSLIGRHRLFERISPKKSWEGFFGGVLVALAASQLFAWYEPDLSRLEWLGLAAVIVIAGTWGDLVESLLKRTLQVKDSGHILPGHGGMLDRFDSVILAIPAAYIYIEAIIRS
ncbi:MAG: phosphatidate cytidylyltransferase [Parabacteroides sp.]